MFEMLLPLTVFSVASTVTPGPNNVMLTASGSAFGFRRSVPHMLGITVGFPLMLFTVGLGLGEIFTRYTQIHLALKYVGAAYLLYLAWRIAQSGQSNGDEADGRRPLTFLEAAAFQWVNPEGLGHGGQRDPGVHHAGRQLLCRAECDLAGFRGGVRAVLHSVVPVRRGDPAR